MVYAKEEKFPLPLPESSPSPSTVPKSLKKTIFFILLGLLATSGLVGLGYWFWPSSDDLTFKNLALGQELLKFKTDPSRPYIPVVIRIAFHALRSCAAHIPKGDENNFLLNWNRSVVEGFDVKDFVVQTQGTSVFGDLVDRLAFTLRAFGLGPEVRFDSVGSSSTYFAIHSIPFSGPIMTETGSYRPIALAVHVKGYGSEGTHNIYLRDSVDDKWIMIADQTAKVRHNISNAEVLKLKPVFVLYQQTDTGKFTKAAPSYYQSRLSVPFNAEIPFASSIIRLVKHIGPYLKQTLPITDSADFFNFMNQGPRFLAEAVEKYFPSNCKKPFSQVLAESFKKCGCDVSDYKSASTPATATFSTPGSVQLGPGGFVNDSDYYYHAIAFAIPKDSSKPNGAQLVYLRRSGEYNWFLFDNLGNIGKSQIPHDQLSNLLPTVIVYIKVSQV